MFDWDALDDPLAIAQAMWNRVSSQGAEGISPDRFRTLFDRVYQDCEDVTTLWQLGGAANDYLRTFPDALAVPDRLPLTLLSSDNIKARVVGLKLLNRCDITDEVMVAEIIRAMRRSDEYERTGGVYELGQFLDRKQMNRAKLDPVLCTRLHRILNIFRNHHDPDRRRNAAFLIERLRELSQLRRQAAIRLNHVLPTAGGAFVATPASPLPITSEARG